MDNRLHDRFRSGHDANEFVGNYLRAQGIPCEVPEMKLAQTEAEIIEFTENEKDIILEDGSVIEVKSQSRVFSGVPSEYGWPTFIVDTLGFYGKKQRPLAYVFLSKETGEMLALNTNTHETWWRETITDRRDGIPSISLISDKKNLRSMDALIAYLKQRIRGGSNGTMDQA
ncbi:MAG: hypothetical protein ACKN9R_05145 [Candidatus Limnocylindrus sp.]